MGEWLEEGSIRPLVLAKRVWLQGRIEFWSRGEAGADDELVRLCCGLTGSLHDDTML